eukprot:TRINITY_DN29349_c0_g1_i2.p1 TRINITY_DN29349_c0_g1~~TRINITY_DN29349_c0_g1_i2.p1  ORF type:complete len:671 (+),score=96.49 TRINITY_DN29349_c0_g1_i2:68-2080(+)
MDVTLSQLLVSLAEHGSEAVQQERDALPGWQRVVDNIDDLDQSMLALASILIGSCLVARGFAVVKLSVVLAISVSISWHTWSVARSENSSMSGAVASLVVLVCALIFAHRIYQLMVFLFGCILGGVAVFACRDPIGLGSSPGTFLGLLVLVPVLVGLAFQHYRSLGWRLVTPVIGGLLVAATARYMMVLVLDTNTARWLDFDTVMASPASSLLTACGAFFAGSWGVAAVIGWYSQLSAFFGGNDPLALPASMIINMSRLQTMCPYVFDEGIPLDETFATWMAGKPAAQPLLGEPEVSREGRNYRAEAILFLTAASVLVLNMFMLRQPLLFLGHVVLMSAGFLTFMTAGFLSYASPGKILPGLSAPSKNTPLLRHFTHATSMVLALFCVMGGYLCMYAQNFASSKSQFGLSAGTSWCGTLHVFLGYAVLALMLSMTFSGAAKMLAGLTGIPSTSVATHHRYLGKVMYGLAAIVQLLGYFVHGLMPLWGSLLLSAMLLAAVGSTVLLLAARSADMVDHVSTFNAASDASTDDMDVIWVNPCKLAEEGQFHSNLCKLGEPRESWMQSSTSQGSTVLLGRLESLRSCALSSSSRSHEPGAARRKRGIHFEAMLDSLDKQDNLMVLRLGFQDWHRNVQASKISKADADLQGTNNLVDFLSQALVGSGSGAQREGP